MRIRTIISIIAPALSIPVASGTESADSIHPLGEVVVTGSNCGVSKNRLPYTVSVIGEERLQSTGQTQVLSAISGMVPSLFVSERSIFGFGVSNGGSGHIKMRGVGGDRASAVLISLLRDSRGVIYAGTYNGVARLDSQTDMFTPVRVRVEHSNL